jgi:hypothetical protein
MQPWNSEQKRNRSSFFDIQIFNLKSEVLNIFSPHVRHEIVDAAMAVVVRLVEVIALGALEGSERRGHADNMLAASTTRAGWNDHLRGGFHGGPPVP